MAELDTYISNLESLESTLVDKAKEAILSKQGQVLGNLKLRLFNTGTDGDGNKIKPDYAYSTVQIKASKKQRTSHVTLRDTGDFYKSMFIDFNKGNVFVNSNDSKSGSLINKYGKSIMELTLQEQRIIIDTIIEPFLVKEIKKLNKNIDLF